MKKYIPYIAIPILSYLVVAFIKMQVNPQYWESGERGGMLIGAVAAIAIYFLLKGLINAMKE